MSWIVGSFFLIVTQICWIVADRNTSDLAADWKGNLTSDDMMNFTAKDISGIKVKTNWFGDEPGSSNVVLNKTFIKTMESAKEVKARNESFSLLLQTKLDDEDEDQERRARGTTSKVTHSEDEATTYSPVLNNGHLDANEEDNSIFIMKPGITTEKNHAQVNNTLPTPWIRHVSGDNLHLDYFDHNNMNYPTRSPFQVCFATNSHLYPEESELPTCESMEMEDEIVECDLPELSCRNRCQEDLYDIHVNPDLGMPSCYCGARCLLYNSCCEDFEEQCPGTYVEGKEQLDLFEGKQAVCSKHVRVMLIAHCPRDTSDEQLRNQCENPDLSRIAYLFPVTDSVSGHHFQNIYCWKCWSMTGDVVHWQAAISFNSENAHKDEYNRQPMVSIIVNEPWRVLWLPVFDHSSFPCESCAVSRCTGCRHADETKGKRCSSLNSAVEIDDITYANKYCYTCSQEYLDTHNSEKTFRNDNLAQCRIPPVPDQAKFENVISYHTFNFYVVASVTEETMLLQVDLDTDYSAFVTFLWSSMNCTDDASECDVIECRPSFQLDSHQCALPKATEEGAMQIKLILSDLSPFPKLSVSVKEVFDTLKQLCEESIEQEFQSSKFAVKNWVTDVLNMALYLQYESADDLYEIEQYLKFKSFLLVKATEALNIHKVPGITDICVAQFENGLPIQLDPSDCLFYGSHLGSRASSLLSVPKSLMWTSVFLCLASF